MGQTLSESSVCVFVWWSGSVTLLVVSEQSQKWISTVFPKCQQRCLMVLHLWGWGSHKDGSVHLVESYCGKPHTAMRTMRRGPSDVLKHLRGPESAEGDTQILHGFLPLSACLRVWHSQKSSPNKIGLDGQKYFGSSIQFFLWFMASGPLSILHISSFVQSSVMQLGTAPFVRYAEMFAPWEHPQ